MINKNWRITTNKIAELTGKKHGDITETIRYILKMIDRLESISTGLIITKTKFTSDKVNKQYTNYTLNEQGLMILMMHGKFYFKPKLIDYLNQEDTKISNNN